MRAVRQGGEMRRCRAPGAAVGPTVILYPGRLSRELVAVRLWCGHVRPVFWRVFHPAPRRALFLWCPECERMLPVDVGLPPW